jgi:hypothetical protein
MKQSKFRLGTGIVQLVPLTLRVKPQREVEETKLKEDSIISSKFIKIFAVIAVIKVIVFFMLW